MTKIVVLDECDLSQAQVERLRELGDVVMHSTMPREPSEIESRLAGADVCILGWTSLSGEVLRRLSRLRMISVWATGYDYVDVEVAAQSGISVANVPFYAGQAVSEFTFGLIVGLVRNIPRGNRRVRDGNLSRQGLNGMQLSGRTLGLVGVGDIGSRVAKMARGFGMHVVAHARRMSTDRQQALSLEFLPLDQLLALSDIVSLHTPLTGDTARLIGATEFSIMRPGSYLINTSRAGLVDQAALFEALTTGNLAGAGLDDLDPSRPDIAALDNVIATPHIGFSTDTAVSIKGDICVSNVEAYLAGRPENIVASPAV